MNILLELLEVIRGMGIPIFIFLCILVFSGILKIYESMNKLLYNLYKRRDQYKQEKNSVIVTVIVAIFLPALPVIITSGVIVLFKDKAIIVFVLLGAIKIVERIYEILNHVYIKRRFGEKISKRD